MAGAWQTRKVFISSTFRDMQAEREHLARHVFPLLRQELLEWRIHLLDVDLRWGITSEQNVIAACHEIIDECRPRFICLLGERYGTIPSGEERSITHDEIVHAVLDPPPGTDARYSYFYFRDPRVTASIPQPFADEYREPPDSDRAGKLDQLKTDISDAGFEPFIYPCRWDPAEERIADLDELGQRVHDDLLASIRDEFGAPPTEVRDWFEEENAQQEAFVEERVARFVVGSRRPLLDELARFASASDEPSILAVTGPPGSGKSALLAQFSREYSRDHHQDSLATHFIGASTGSTDLRLMLRRLCDQLARAAGVDEALPDDIRELPQAFERLLGQAAGRAHLVLVLDALNQLDDAYNAHSLFWLPRRLPENVRIIASSLPHPALEALLARRPAPQVLECPPLTDDDAGYIIDSFLQRYSKRMEPHQRQALLGKPDAQRPLYLLAALEELRTLGTYEQITGRINELPGDTPGLFEWILGRLEDEYGRPAVEAFASYIAASRHGLSEQELVGLLQQSESAEAMPDLRLALRPYLMFRGELIASYHEQFRQAVQRRYLREAALQQRHSELADYFRGQGYGYLRTLTELPHHLLSARRLRDTAELLTDGDFIEAKIRLLWVHELLGDFVQAEAVLSTDTVGDDLSDRFQQWRQFLLSRQHRLAEEPRLLVQEAHNWARTGAAADYAEAHAGRAGPFLRLINRPAEPLADPCQMTLEGHSGGVWAVAITPDGKRAVSGSEDHTLRVWDLQTGQEVARFHCADWAVTCACGGSHLVVGDTSGRVYMLALENCVLGPPVQTAWRAPSSPRPSSLLYRLLRRRDRASGDEHAHTLAVRCPWCEGYPFRAIAEGEAALGRDWPCPVCGNTIHLNPFVIEADWRPLAAEQERGG